MAKAESKEQKKVRRPSALKRDIQSEKRRLRNRSFKSQVRSIIRNFDETVKKGDKKEIQASLDQVYSIMDKGVKHGVYKANKASRTKSRVASRAFAKT